MHVETSINKTYIVEEILIFILYYFEPFLRTRINRVQRHDDVREVPSSRNLSIFSHFGRFVPKTCCEEKIFDRNRIRQAYNVI